MNPIGRLHKRELGQLHVDTQSAKGQHPILQVLSFHLECLLHDDVLRHSPCEVMLGIVHGLIQGRLEHRHFDRLFAMLLLKIQQRNEVDQWMSLKK